MRRLSRFFTAHSLEFSAPHGKCRDELGVIADRHATSAATVPPTLTASSEPVIPVGGVQMVA